MAHPLLHPEPSTIPMFPGRHRRKTPDHRRRPPSSTTRGPSKEWSAPPPPPPKGTELRSPLAGATTMVVQGWTPASLLDCPARPRLVVKLRIEFVCGWNWFSLFVAEVQNTKVGKIASSSVPHRPTRRFQLATARPATLTVPRLTSSGRFVK